MKVKLSKPYILDEDLGLINEVIKSGWLAHGPKTKQFEEDFAKYIGSKYATALNSCASALQLAIEALDIKGEIIVPSFTFVASANAIIKANCEPVFADIDYDTCNIDADKLEALITNDTKAIMPVHFAGQSCDMDKIMALSRKYGLYIIEDSAETIGGEFNGKRTGSFGIGCFSFYPTKNMTTGEGGMITLDNKDLFEKIKSIKAHGIGSSAYDREKESKPWKRSAVIPGYNFRMSDINSAIGLTQLKRLDEMNKMRRDIAEIYNNELNKLNIDLPVEKKSNLHVYQMYTIKLKGQDRSKFIANLRENGVEASVHFDPPVHLQKWYFENIKPRTNLEITEKVSNNIVTLPLYAGMTESETSYVVDNVKRALHNL